MNVQQLPHLVVHPIETHASETGEGHNILLPSYLILPDNSYKQGGTKHIFRDDHQQTSKYPQHFPSKQTLA